MKTILLSIAPNDLETVLIDAEHIAEVYNDENFTNSLNLQNTWHAMHYMLTGQDTGGESPLCYSVEAEYPFPHVTSEGEIVRYNSAVLVSEISEALNQIDTKKFREHFDAEKMAQAQIYPEQWEIKSEIKLDQLSLIFIQFKTFYQHAHDNNHAVVSLMIQHTDALIESI